METFAPFLADSLEDLNKVFLSFYVNKGFQAQGVTNQGIKGKKVRKGLSTLYSLYSCPALVWAVDDQGHRAISYELAGEHHDGLNGLRVLPQPAPAGNAHHVLFLVMNSLLGGVC